MVDRGQAYTLEGVLAAILVVTATVYGLQAIDTRAWEDETQAETQQVQSRASDVLSLAGESGALRNTVMCYQEGSTISGNSDGSLTEFERMLNITFDRQADQYNLYFSYWDSDANRRVTELVSQSGDESRPPTTAASATATVTISDNTSRRDNNCNPVPPTVKETEDSFYMSDAAEDSPLFNVVEVRLVAW